MAQREASQYITAFRNPSSNSYVESIGIAAFFDTQLRKHTDFGEDRRREARSISTSGSQPGAMTGMLNWYRASAIIVPAMDATPERPAFLDGPFPPVTQPTLVIWGMHDKALLPSQLDGLEALVPDLTRDQRRCGPFRAVGKPGGGRRHPRLGSGTRPHVRTSAIFYAPCRGSRERSAGRPTCVTGG